MHTQRQQRQLKQPSLLGGSCRTVLCHCEIMGRPHGNGCHKLCQDMAVLEVAESEAGSEILEMSDDELEVDLTSQHAYNIAIGYLA